MKKLFYYDTPIGKIGIAEKEGYITDLFFHESKAPSEVEIKETHLLKKASEQLFEYFSGKRMEFDLPLLPEGKSFESKCWEILQTIPYGETRSYGQQAVLLGNPKACRAVGGANSRNPISIFIPCHRVIGANGSLTGFGGGLEIKRFLLALEKNTLARLSRETDLFSEIKK